MEPIVNTAKRLKRKKLQNSDDEGRLDKAHIPKTAHDIAKLKLEKLMKDPDKLIEIPNKRKEWKPREAPEFVRHVMGSSAGAGSGEFHVYRGIRERETKRTEYLDAQAAKEEENRKYQREQEINRINAEKRTDKLRQKRLKKKRNKQARRTAKRMPDELKHPKVPEVDQSDKSEGSETEEKHFVIGGK